MLENPKGSPLSVFFGTVRFFSEIFFHKRVPNSPIGHIEVLLLFLSLRYGADLGRSRLVLIGTYFDGEVLKADVEIVCILDIFQSSL